MNGRVQDKVAIVTGGGSGIGRAICLMLAREGAKVVVTDVNGPHAQETADQITKAGGKAISMVHDVSKEDVWKEVADRTVKEFGGLDVVVNNAGIGPVELFNTLTLKQWETLISINLTGAFLGTREAMRVMNKPGRKSWGSIINMSSVLGFVGKKGATAYCASKGGVRLFTKATAVEAATSGWPIRVNSVHPGFIETPMVMDSKALTGDATAKDDLVGCHPMGRLGKPDEIAYGVLFLASDESSYMTGTELVIDGGYTAW